MSALLERIIAGGLILAIVFTALAHGAVEPWSIAVFELILLILVVLWAIQAAVDKRLKLYVPSTAFPLASLITLGLAQSLVVTDGDGRRLSLSLDVEATRAAVTMLAFLLIALLLAANFWVRRTRFASLQRWLVVYGMVLAIFALVQYFAWDGRFYWLRTAVGEEMTAPFGPFVSHSHFAGYLELIIPLPVALLITHAIRGEARLFYGLAAVLMVVAAIASLSRGGLIALIAQLLLLGLASLRYARWRAREIGEEGHAAAWAGERSEENDLVSASPLSPLARPSARSLSLARSGVLATLVGAVALGILWLGPAPVVERVSQGKVTSSDAQAETFFTSRGWIWRDTLAMIRANPITGVGLGAYATAFPNYTQSDGTVAVGAAHNDYLQVLADAGIIGGALAIWFVVILWRNVRRGLRARDPLRAGWALGAGVGISGLLVHSFFDFNLQLPAHALLFLMLVAIVAHTGAKVSAPAVHPSRDALDELADARASS